MKILILADHMENGGAETHIYELSRLLSRKGNSVTVFSHGGKIADSLAALGIRQERYGNFPLLRLAQFIQAEKPTVVHAHTRKSAFLCRILLSFMDFPFVFTAHAHFSTEPLRRALSFFPRRTIAVSADIARHLSKGFGVAPKNIAVIGNGINTERFCPKRDKRVKNHILTVSRLDADCSLTASLLCRIAPMLWERFEGLRITVIGGGSELERIRALAEKANRLCGQEVVRVLGSKQNVLPYLQSASLFVGVSRAALEAMSCELPVILSGDEGYLGIAAGNTITIAEETNFCARGKQKPSAKRLFRDIVKVFSSQKLADRAAIEGQKQVTLYHTAEHMAEKTLGVYRAAVRDSFAKRKSDILLCGYYGYGNLGDELTLRSISASLHAAAKQNPLFQNTAYSDSPLAPSPLRLSVLAPKGKQYQGLTSIDRLHPIAVIDAIRHTGLFVLGGGSLLQNKTSNRSLFYYLLLLETAHFFGIPSMLYASGIGPINRKLPYLLCKHALLKTDLITVRDIDSFAFLNRMGVKDNLFLSADPVLFCKMPKPKKKGYVLAFVRDGEIERCFELLRKVKAPILLAVMDKKRDLAATKRLASKLLKYRKNVRLTEDLSASAILSLIGGADLVVSARLHALILAFCMGVSFLGLSDDPKISAFSRMAYEGCTRPIKAADISSHFRQKRKDLLSLAATDAKRALGLSLDVLS